MSEQQIKKMSGEPILDILEKQYLEANNKEDIDFWTPLSKIILESIECRDFKKISQADLAEKMKTRQSVISRFENMGRLPNYDFIARLAIALDHKPGMTLYGDYMAVVPLEKQDLIKKLADNEKITTNKFVQNLLEQGINRASIYSNSLKIFYATSKRLSGIENLKDIQNKQKNMHENIYPITASNALKDNNLAIAS